MGSLGVSGRILVLLSSAAIAACGGGGYGGGDGGSPPTASISLSIDPSTITLGQSATLTWNTNGASCTATGSWSGTKSATGSEDVTPTATGTFTYTLSCAGGGYGESARRSVMLTVEAAAAFTSTLLVAGFSGSEAVTTDRKLVSPRGLAVAEEGPVRVVGRGMAIAFDGGGKPDPALRSAEGEATPATGGMELTDVVANLTREFVLNGADGSGPAEFIFASKDGVIGAWRGGMGPADAVIVHVAPDGAVYTGLAVAEHKGRALLYAADLRNSKVDVFDATFMRQPSRPGRFDFADPALPTGYAPFGIHAIAGGADGTVQLYVTYARQLPPDNRDSATGAGLGLVNVFDTNGNLLQRLVQVGGALNAPWGVARAPADFGSLGGALLIGNTGDGTINAFDDASGRHIGTVSDADGRAIARPGLWGLTFGNDSHRQPHDTLFFTAATDETDGVLGRIDVGLMPHAPGIDD